jgi:hypothetical protein
MSEIVQPTRSEPINWSRYEPTGNNAIDLCAQCIGYHRSVNKPLKAIILKASYYDLFRAGVEVLMKRHGKKLDAPAENLTFDEVLIKKGSMLQFDSIICEYHDMPIVGVN